VREGLVRLGHLVLVLAALHRGTLTVRGVDQLTDETLGHRVLAALTRVVHQPAKRQRRPAVRLDLDRHLVRRAADAPGANLQQRPRVLVRSLIISRAWYTVFSATLFLPFSRILLINWVTSGFW
jgi:hypothetical protein